jgi:hypothetical protein
MKKNSDMKEGIGGRGAESLAREPLSSKIQKIGRLMELKILGFHVGRRVYSGMDMWIGGRARSRGWKRGRR